MFWVWIYSVLSVVVVSLIAFVGIVTFSVKEEKLGKILLYLVSFAAGGLLGGAFLHLLPEVVSEYGFTPFVSLSVLAGIVTFFVVEKLIHWRHCHIPTSAKHPHPFAYMNLIGDGVHNFIDGLIIAGSYLVDISLGLTTTFAVILHEIPQEIGDFSVLVYGGFKKGRALLLNFVTALTAVIGALVALSVSMFVGGLSVFLIPFAAGGFIYIASTDLIPELHKGCYETRKSVLQLAAFILGVIVMYSILLLE